MKIENKRKAFNKITRKSVHRYLYAVYKKARLRCCIPVQYHTRISGAVYLYTYIRKEYISIPVAAYKKARNVYL